MVAHSLQYKIGGLGMRVMGMGRDNNTVIFLDL